jgi:ABC-type sugar transport system ATPase subunit
MERLKSQTQVKFGIRPEHITAGGHSESAVHMVDGTLRFMEHMGSEVFVHFTLGEIPLTARVPADQLRDLAGKARGDRHAFGIQMDACHAFDMDTGLNLFL